MVIAFFGHAQYIGSEQDATRLSIFLEKYVGDRPAQMYLGGYGAFDSFAFSCCKRYQASHPTVSLVYVTPYLDRAMPSDQYDESLYPPLEKVPPRYAILHRNRCMVDKADRIVVYVDHSWGGAYSAYQYAKGKGKKIYNLALPDENPDFGIFS